MYTYIYTYIHTYGSVYWVRRQGTSSSPWVCTISYRSLSLVWSWLPVLSVPGPGEGGACHAYVVSLTSVQWHRDVFEQEGSLPIGMQCLQHALLWCSFRGGLGVCPPIENCVFWDWLLWGYAQYSECDSSKSLLHLHLICVLFLCCIIYFSLSFYLLLLPSTSLFMCATSSSRANSCFFFPV